MTEKQAAIYSSLTEIEVEGLGAKYSLADGHAYHEMPSALQPVVQDIMNIWNYAASKSVPDIEKEFKCATAKIIGSPTLARLETCSISPTASNSIDIVGAWLNLHQRKVGLLEPVFDNLYLLLNRRGVSPVSVTERDLVDTDRLTAKIDREKLDSLFIVTPNNPTGFELTEQELKNLCDLCARKKVALFVDTTFRFYSKQEIDTYKILEESGVDYTVIEDTGKTFPTQDLKASLMVSSKSLAKDMRTLYEEIFLCSSNFTLALLSRLLEKTHEVGLDKVVWSEVAARTKYVENALAGTPLTFAGNSSTCSLPVTWLDCSATGLNDMELVQKLGAHQVVLLPGRFFYWGSQKDHTNNVRLSLMKPGHVFYCGVDILKEALPKITTQIPNASSVDTESLESELPQARYPRPQGASNTLG